MTGFRWFARVWELRLWHIFGPLFALRVWDTTDGGKWVDGWWTWPRNHSITRVYRVERLRSDLEYLAQLEGAVWNKRA